MKRIICFLAVLACLMMLCGCGETKIKEDAAVTLHFCCYENDIVQELTAEESAKVIEILNGNTYDPLPGVPACGFSKEVSFEINGRFYAVAMDTCNNMQDLGSLRFFPVTEDGIDYIHALFEKYGGYFPCV
ncbi:MAG: hypothetical protein IJY91_02735 [Oscillospiraceae bacterium]|nr:hypothetical protein [Oscillospiraceae bacterium]